MAKKASPLLARVRNDLRAAVTRALPLRPRDHLVRFMQSPVAEHLPPRFRALGSQLWCRYHERLPLRQSLVGKTACLFASFDAEGVVHDYVIFHLSRLQQAGVHIIFITTSPTLPDAELRKLEPYCAAVIERENIGHDFGSWRTGLLLYPELLQCRTLLFANDSVYGPMGDLDALLKKMARTGCDFFAITESAQIQPHYQSYFLGFQQSCLRSLAFTDYCNDIRLLTNKDEIIQNYEVKMKAQLCEQNLRGAALVPATPDLLPHENPTLHRWRQILDAGSPYLKAQLLRENPHGQPIGDWPEVVRAHGYDPALIERHLRKRS